MDGTSLVLPSHTIDNVSEHARFLILSLPNNEMLQKSPFAIHKAIQGISSEPKSVKKLRSGDLLIETSSALQTKSLLLTKTFLDCPLSVNLHRSLNSLLSCQVPTFIQILKPLLSVPHPNASPSITSNSTSSSTTQANLLPSASSIKPTTKIASRLPKPISSAAAPDNNLNTSASSLSAETRTLIRSNKSAAALSFEIQPLPESDPTAANGEHFNAP
ncbi:RNA-directed DNA polymerase from mobile element jockey [Trichonephila clavipes]|nr:RNA-directed DNA polymerase from mobile element jockey [Trichonephila clavipes]